jgi:hypothetical protein
VKQAPSPNFPLRGSVTPNIARCRPSRMDRQQIIAIFFAFLMVGSAVIYGASLFI